jgi:2-dehydro-3-deoxygluconokinase
MAARLGAQTRLFGRVGGDPLGRRLARFWQSSGVDTSAVVVDDHAPTGIYVNERCGDRPASGRRFTYWRRSSAGSRWCPADVSDPSRLSDVAGVVVTGITFSISPSSTSAAWRLIEHARKQSIPVACILNYRVPLAPDRDALALLASVADVTLASLEDLEHVFPGRTVAESLALARPHEGELVVTHGAGGASVAWGRETVRQRVAEVEARDTVGAGDALAGSYLWARLCARRSPVDALAWGVAASWLSVQRAGCGSSYPDAAATAAARAQLPVAEPCTVADLAGHR